MKTATIDSKALGYEAADGRAQGTDGNSAVYSTPSLFTQAGRSECVRAAYKGRGTRGEKEGSVKNDEMGEQLWGTVLTFDALRAQLLQTCFSTEVTRLAETKHSFSDFIEAMKELVARYETLLAGMEEQ